tara:strand:+ start:353 stop:925 length:573 start_codon:yes stop_codon:yes gene_type:complete
MTRRFHSCILCGARRDHESLNFNEHGFYFAICDREECKTHAESIAKRRYKIRRPVHGPDYTHFEIEKPSTDLFNTHWKIERCSFRSSWSVEFTGAWDSPQCEHPAFWSNERHRMVCSHHAKGDITFSDYYCQVPVEYNDSEITGYESESFIGGCANKATIVIRTSSNKEDNLHVCNHCIQNIPSLEEEQT